MEDARDFDKPVHATKLGREEGESRITAVQFAYPIEKLHTMFLLVGLSSGYIWSIDARTNSLISQIKVSDTAISNIEAKKLHVVISKADDNNLFCWKIPSDEEMAKNRFNYFLGDEKILLLDGSTK
jgi:hypothetical protein